MRDATVINELRRITSPSGLLKMDDVVEAAEAIHSPLHPYFTWDDAKCGRLHRLQEARQLVRSAVEYREIDSKTVEIPVWVSLSMDRVLPGGGYRSTVNVLERPSLRDQRLADLILELQQIKRKCSEFQELRRVYEAIDDLGKKPPQNVPPPTQGGQTGDWPQAT
jgi:hypothetical protein